MFLWSTTCISMSTFVLLLSFAFMSSIPILSSNKSFSKMGFLSNSISVISSFIIEFSKFFVISSFPACPNTRLNT